MASWDVIQTELMHACAKRVDELSLHRRLFDTVLRKVIHPQCAVLSTQSIASLTIDDRRAECLEAVWHMAWKETHVLEGGVCPRYLESILKAKGALARCRTFSFRASRRRFNRVVHDIIFLRQCNFICLSVREADRVVSISSLMFTAVALLLKPPQCGTEKHVSYSRPRGQEIP